MVTSVSKASSGSRWPAPAVQKKGPASIGWWAPEAGRANQPSGSSARKDLFWQGGAAGWDDHRRPTGFSLPTHFKEPQLRASRFPAQQRPAGGWRAYPPECASVDNPIIVKTSSPARCGQGAHGAACADMVAINTGQFRRWVNRMIGFEILIVMLLQQRERAGSG